MSHPRSRWWRFAAITLVAIASTSFAATEEDVQVGSIDAVIWMPDAPRYPLPVVVFSHGLYTCATQSRFITRALADAGYFVIAPNHEDALCSTSVGGFASWRLPGKPPSMWTDADYRNRADDIRSLIEALRHDARFRNRIDLTRLALAGHSLGGYTVLGLAGAWPAWTLPDVKAVLAFAPYTLPFRRNDGLRHLAAPVMYQTGAFDPVFTRPLRRAFDNAPSPKYYVEIERAWHLAWTDLGRTHGDEIVANAIAFLDTYLRAPAAAAFDHAPVRSAELNAMPPEALP